ncbi:MAG: purine-nucleoside phosphorylase, partial [Candidatus Cloacimonetes bacterium]|nr:purine-nucleoside phosphorylase [Candidatus Cloacimonadota bacterium]
MHKKIAKATNAIKEKIDFNPEVGIILGTGLNDIARIIEDPVIIDYKEIPGMLVSTAPSHKGRFIAGSIENKKVIIMQGRLHYYEGYSMKEITFPVRVMKALGIKYLIITNAAGSLNEELRPGKMVIICDHLNLMGDSPLIGENPD